MAAKLDDLKFNDYTLKGVSNDSDGYTFTLGHSDVIQDEYNGATQHDNVIAHDYSSGCSSYWRFHGVSDHASTAFQLGFMESGSSGACYSGGRWVFKGMSESVGNDDGPVLYYDTDDGWVFHGTADEAYSANGFYAPVQAQSLGAGNTRDGGNVHYSFTGVGSVPSYSRHGSSATVEELEAWIYDFVAVFGDKGVALASD